jgi:hypothetical protein
MTEHQDTEQAPTAAAEQAETTTEMPEASHAAATPEAWSLDDTTDLDSPPRHSRLVWSGLVALVVALAGALIFFGTTLFGSGSPKPVEPSAKPAPSTTLPVAAPPATVTVTPPPTLTVTAEAPSLAPSAAPTASETPLLSATDQQFLTVLRNQGLSYPDPAYAISHAKATCEFMATHRGQSADDYVVRTTVWTGGLESVEFAEYSARNYCPQFASE